MIFHKVFTIMNMKKWHSIRWQRFFLWPKLPINGGSFCKNPVYHAQEAWEILLGGMAAVTHFLQNMVILTTKFESG